VKKYDKIKKEYFKKKNIPLIQIVDKKGEDKRFVKSAFDKNIKPVLDPLIIKN